MSSDQRSLELVRLNVMGKKAKRNAPIFGRAVVIPCVSKVCEFYSNVITLLGKRHPLRVKMSIYMALITLIHSMFM